jgi:hypothetical protein
MATEQAVSRADSDRTELIRASAAAASAEAERDRLAGVAQNYGLLKQKYAQKSLELKKARR